VPLEIRAHIVLFCFFTCRVWRDVIDWPLGWKGISWHRLWNVPGGFCFLVTYKKKHELRAWLHCKKDKTISIRQTVCI